MSILYFNRIRKFIFLFDLVILNFILLIAHYLIFKTVHPNISSRIFILIANVSWIIIASLNHNYKIFQPLNVNDIVDRFMTTLVYQALFLFGVIYFFKIFNISRGFVLITFFIFFLAIIVQRIFLVYFIRSTKTREFLHKDIVVWGCHEIAESLLQFFGNHAELGYKPRRFSGGDDHVGLFEQLCAQAEYPDEIFVCYKAMTIQTLDEIILFCRANNINLHVVFDNVGNGSRGISYADLPILHLNNSDQVSLKIRVIKRLFDISFALLVMITGLPVFILVYLITKFTSPGGAFYKQERLGKGETPFHIYKFRSMYIDAEKYGPQLSSENDPRITRWGRIMRRTRLDELPQFWNVLKGDMSVVGYRPERKHYIDEISKHSPEYRKMLCHKPGITSLGQVHYGYAENVEQMCERLKFDLLYFRNMTLDVDLGIILKTVRVMAQGSGK